MSSRGWVVGASAAGAVAVGLWLQWAALVAIAAGLASLVLIALTLRRPRSASWADVSAPVRVVRGDLAILSIAVNVQGPTRWVSAVDDSGHDRVFLPFPSAGDLTWPIDTSRRGLFHIGPSRLEFGDPLGIRTRVLASRSPSPILVVPRIHPVATAVADLTLADNGEERAGSESFHSVREYVVGDPMKLVHWKASARTGTLMVRRMVDTTTPWLVVILDVNARAYDHTGSMFEDFDADAFERAVDTAASWAWHGCGPSMRVLLTTSGLAGLDSPAVEVTAGNRESALDWLATVSALPSSACGPGRVEALLKRQGVSRAVIVTGPQGSTASSWAAGWRHRAPVTVLAESS